MQTSNIWAELHNPPVTPIQLDAVMIMTHCAGCGCGQGHLGLRTRQEVDAILVANCGWLVIGERRYCPDCVQICERTERYIFDSFDRGEA